MRSQFGVADKGLLDSCHLGTGYRRPGGVAARP